MNILIVDTETGGLDPKVDPLVELGLVLWNVEARAIVHARSYLVIGDSNAAESVNRIPVRLLAPTRWTLTRAQAVEMACSFANGATQNGADVLAAHNADFDRAFLPELNDRRWLDTKSDCEWPGVPTGASLNETSLALLGYAVRGHRALADCLTIARCFEKTAELLEYTEGSTGFDKWLAHALRPRAVFEVADKRFDEARNAKAKELGFRWDAAAKSWRRRLAIEDAKAMPFEVRRVA